MTKQQKGSRRPTLDDENGKPPSTALPKEKSVTLEVGQYPGEAAEIAIARAKLSPSVQGALTVVAARWGDVYSPIAADINAVANELNKRAQSVSANDLSRLEEMLTVQAYSLDAVWNDCARRARANISQYPLAFERYMRTALKAQGQCRLNIEALAEIKNPKPFIAVGQANVANGHQQVNNATAPPVHAHAGENSDPSNKLLEQKNGARLDTSSPSTTGAGHSSMETVAKIHGSKIS